MVINAALAEICNSGVDEDLDSFIDCLDTDCNGNAFCPDSDGDTVNDEIDIDDDNDGIPDIYEQGCTEPDTILKWRNISNQYFTNGSPGNNENQIFTIENGINATFSVDLTNIGSATQIQWNHNFYLGESFVNPFANFTNLSEYWSFDIDFDSDQNGLAFLVRDIDLQDAVGVIGYLNGVSETPDIEVFAVDMTAVVELDGSVTSYSSINSNIPSNDTRGIVKVSFDSPIDKLRIIRKSNPNLATNPGYGAVEICDLTVCSGSSDTDSDGVLDYVDIDSDNDGIYDIVEAGFGSNDTDGDGFADGSVGLNGLLDSLETFVDSGELQNTVNDSNGNGTYDHVEIDSDGDGCNDVIEAGFLDSNNDGILGGLPLTVTVQGAVNYTP